MLGFAIPTQGTYSIIDFLVPLKLPKISGSLPIERASSASFYYCYAAICLW
jgi:hypothetical protein